MRKWILIGAGIAVVALAAAAGAYVLVKERQSADVRGSSTVEFVPTAPAAAPEKLPGVLWEAYRYGPDRLGVAQNVSLRPPFQRIWTFHAQALVEFPPVVAFGRLYVATNKGDVFAVNAKTGKRAWVRHVGRCQASSPAVGPHLVYVTFLNKPPCNRRSAKGIAGEIVAYWGGSGDVRWIRKIGPSESSPIVDAGYVYVADWSGRVWKLVAGTGAVRWVTNVGGQVKGGPTVSSGHVYVGDYKGHLTALDDRTGKVVWRASSQARLGGRGTFYATPAAAYGRVYVGATDGKMYSYGATTGKLRWSHGTGGYVYSSPAVWRKRIYVGSYSKKFFCFDAATGDVKWTFEANGPISGSPTIVDGIVYFSTLKRRTYALDATTGKQVWGYPDGKYSPVVADTHRLYLVGYARVYGMVEKQ